MKTKKGVKEKVEEFFKNPSPSTAEVLIKCTLAVHSAFLKDKRGFFNKLGEHIKFNKWLYLYVRVFGEAQVEIKKKIFETYPKDIHELIGYYHNYKNLKDILWEIILIQSVDLTSWIEVYKGRNLDEIDDLAFKRIKNFNLGFSRLKDLFNHSYTEASRKEFFMLMLAQATHIEDWIFLYNHCGYGQRANIREKILGFNMSYDEWDKYLVKNNKGAYINEIVSFKMYMISKSFVEIKSLLVAPYSISLKDRKRKLLDFATTFDELKDTWSWVKNDYELTLILEKKILNIAKTFDQYFYIWMNANDSKIINSAFLAIENIDLNINQLILVYKNIEEVSKDKILQKIKMSNATTKEYMEAYDNNMSNDKIKKLVLSKAYDVAENFTELLSIFSLVDEDKREILSKKIIAKSNSMKRLFLLVINFGYFDLGYMAINRLEKLDLSFNSWKNLDSTYISTTGIEKVFKEMRLKKMIKLAKTFDQWESIYSFAHSYSGDRYKIYRKLSLEKLNDLANSYSEWEHIYIISIRESYSHANALIESLNFAVSLKEISLVYIRTSSLDLKDKAIKKASIIKKPFNWWYKRLKDAEASGFSKIVLSGMIKNAKRIDHWEKIYHTSCDIETKELSIVKISEFIVI